MDTLARETIAATIEMPGQLERWFAAQGAPPRIDLARSGASGMTVAELLRVTGETEAAFVELSLDYGPGRGGERLVAAIRNVDVALPGTSVVVASGAVEALLLLCIARGGGEVLVGTPAYGGLIAAPRGAGRTVTEVCVWDSMRGLHFDDIASRITRATDMVVVNSPHNPSGAQASLHSLDELARECARHGALLVLDEVARGTLDAGAVSAVRSEGFAHGTTVVVGDVSKSLGLGGLRIGWLSTADEHLGAAVAAAKDGTTVASCSLAEHLAAVALEHAARLLAPVRATARRNLDALTGFLAGCGAGAEWTPPVDGLVAFPALPAPRGIDRLVASLRRDDVAVVPGSLFGEPGRVRIGIGCAPGLFAEGLQRIGEQLSLQ